MPYQKTNFINNNEPPISAQNLNKMEQGIYDNSVAVEEVTTLLGGHYVQKDVPANAVFTDTIYDDTEITERITTAESDIDDLQESTEHLSDGEVTYPYASEIEIEDALGVNAKDVSVKITAQQDLHGYDHPWVGGAGVNKLNEYDFVNNTWLDAGTGSYYSFSGRKATQEFQPCLPNTTYFFGAYNNGIVNTEDYTLIVCWYDSSKNFISTQNRYVTAHEITSPNNAYYFRLGCTNTSYLCAVNYPSTNTSYSQYSNICPISGWDECEIDRVGKNLWDLSTSATGYITQNGDVTTVGAANFKASDYIRIEPNVAYTVSYNRPQSAVINENGMRIAWYDKNKTFIKRDGTLETATAGIKSYTGTAPSNAYYARVSSYCIANSTDNQFEFGSSLTDYEPYHHKTYTIQLGDTIYCGTIGANTGVMTVTHVLTTFKGEASEAWNMSSDTGWHQFYLGIGASTKSANAITNEFEGMLISDRGSKTGFILYTDKTYRFALKDSDILIESIADWKTWLASHNLQVCYELATPITIQLTPQQIQLLEGYNLISANTGDIQVTTTDIKGAIGQADELIEANTQAINEIDSFNDSIFGTVETGTTASKAYAQGDYFVKDKKMCKALTSIANGATFTLNTNYAAYTIADILKAIEQS